MKNFIETLLNIVRNLVNSRIKRSVADWNQNDPNSDNYVKNRTHWVDENGEVHKLETKFLELPKNLATTEEVSEFKEEVRVSFEEVGTDISELESDSEEMSGKLLTYDTNRYVLPYEPSSPKIVYGNGKFIIVPNNTNTFYSDDDGIHWVEANHPCSNNSLSRIKYVGGKFFALRSSSSYYCNVSTDGINWQEAYIRRYSSWFDIAYGNGKFVVVSNSSDTSVAYSDDGINWNSSYMPITHRATAIEYGDGKFIVTTREGYVLYSVDGINWQKSSFSYSDHLSLVYQDGKFVALFKDNGSSTIAIYSTDGLTWEKIVSPTGGSYKGGKLVYGDGKFVIIPSNGYTENKLSYGFYSTDGINWQEFNLPTNVVVQSPDIAYGDKQFILVCSNTKIAHSSADGITWVAPDSVALAQNLDDKTSEIRSLLLDGRTIPVPDVAEVGDSIVVKSVNAKGAPIEWETKKLATEEYVDTALENVGVSDDHINELIDTKLEEFEPVIPDSSQNVDLTGYAKEAWVQEGFQPKGDYLASTALPTAINTALAQAKASGEFDGADGSDGKDGKDGQDGYTPQKGVDYFDGENGSDGKDGKTPVKGTDYFTEADKQEIAEQAAGLIEIPSGFVASDTAPTDTSVFWIDTSDDSNDGFQEAVNIALTQAKASGAFDGADGKDGKDGEPGASGTSVTVKSVSESTADGGSNIVTFSDGKTLTVKNGSKGSTGSKGDKGDKGDAYTLTDADKNSIVNAVIAALPVYTGEVV